MTKKILLMLLIIVMIVGGIAYFLSAKTTKEKKVFTLEEIANLKEISISGNFVVNITASDSKEIRCNFSKMKKGLVIDSSSLIESKIENNVLYINEDKKEYPICIGGGITKIVDIDIPKDYQNKLSIKSELNKINILNSNSKDINCDVKESDITISLENISGNITAKSYLGNINLKLPKDQNFKLSANCNLGEIDNKLTSNVDPSLTDKCINLDATQGNININGN